MPVADDKSLQRQYEWMLLARSLEQRMAGLYRQGQVTGGVYLGRGQEALSAALGMALRPGDVFAPLIRDMAGRLAFGESIEEALRVCLSKATSKMRGRDGNVHRGDLSQGLIPMISHLGAMVSVIGGLILAKRQLGTWNGEVGAAVIGDGGINTGACNEAMNVIGIERLPVVLLLANNAWSYSTQARHSYPDVPLLERGKAFGWGVHRCDGRDADQARQVLAHAVAAARADQGPQLVEGVLLRLCGHGEHDDGAYMGDERLQPEQDCLHRTQQRLREAGHDQAWFEVLQADCDRRIQVALDTVLPEPAASVADEDWQAYADHTGLMELRSW